MIKRAHGFSVVELVVVLGVIAIIGAITLPAIQNARETARRTQCSNHLRQLGMALLQYHDTHKSFPSGQVSVLQQTDAIGRFADPLEAKQQGGSSKTRLTPQGQSWILSILPQLGQESISNRWSTSKNVYANGQNGGPAVEEIAGLYCPSRRNGMRATGIYSGAERVDQSWTTGGSDYAACTGSGVAFKDDDPDKRQTYWLNPNQLAATVLPSAIGSIYAQSPSHTGVFGVNSGTSISQILDGTSVTILAAERRLFSNASSGFAVPPANTSTPNQRRSSDGWAFGGPATLFATRLAPEPPGAQFGRHFDEAGSEHPLGINIVCADGSVRFISLNIDLRTWNHLGNMGQGSSVNLF